MKKLLFILLTLFLYVFPVYSAVIGDFNANKKMEFATTGSACGGSGDITCPTITGSQTDFTVVVEINASSWSSDERDVFFGAWNVNGTRIQFYDNANNALKYSELSYDNSGKTAIYFVKVPAIASGDDGTNNYIKVGFGNDPNGSAQDDIVNTWDSYYKGVWHFGEASTPAYDDTVNNHDGTWVNNTRTTGYVGYGASFNGSTAYINLGDHNDYSPTNGSGTDQPFSISCWVNLTATAVSSVIFGKWDYPSSTEWLFYYDSSIKPRLELWQSSSIYRGRKYDTAQTAGSWVYLSGTYGGGESCASIDLYRNGVVVDDTDVTGGTYTGISNTATSLYIGGDVYGDRAKATIDECRYSFGIQRSADWEKLSYYSMLKTNFHGDSWYSWSASLFEVTPSAGTGGSLSPSTPQFISLGETTEFTVTTNAGYVLDTISGCGGALVGDTFTTAAITAVCTVTATFTEIINAPVVDMFLDKLYIESSSGVTFKVDGSTLNRPAKYGSNPVYGVVGLSAAIADDGGSMTDETTEASEDTTNDMTLLPAIPAVDDAYYFGGDFQFTTLAIRITTVGNWSGTLAWEYCSSKTGETCTVWSDLPNGYDNTLTFESGTSELWKNVVWDIPSDWVTCTVNSQGPFSYIRARVATYSGITTQPKGMRAYIGMGWEREVVYNYIQNFGDGYKGWISVVSPDSSYQLHQSYITSTDGISWIRPDLGLYTYRNSTSNNLTRPLHSYSGSVIYNPLLARPYIMAEGAFDNGGGGYYIGVRVLDSSDGVSYSIVKTLSEGGTNFKEAMSIIRIPSGEYIGRYLVYYQVRAYYNDREIGAYLSDTTDLSGTWTDLGSLITSSAATNQKYTIGVQYEDGIYFGFVPSYNSTTEQIQNEELWISRDGIAWTLEDATWLTAGASGTWDDAVIWGGKSLIQNGDDWWHYYSGQTENHNYIYANSRLGYSTIGYRRIGQVGTTGNLVSVFYQNADKLYINADASGGNKIEVELLDSNGDPITNYTQTDCDDITIDTYTAQVTWGAYTTIPAQVFAIKFYLSGATLYSYELTESTSNVGIIPQVIILN